MRRPPGSVVTIWVLRRGIVGLYTDDDAAAAVTLSLIGYLVAFHVFDALQGITASGSNAGSCAPVRGDDGPRAGRVERARRVSPGRPAPGASRR